MNSCTALLFLLLLLGASLLVLCELELGEGGLGNEIRQSDRRRLRDLHTIPWGRGAWSKAPAALHGHESALLLDTEGPGRLLGLNGVGRSARARLPVRAVPRQMPALKTPEAFALGDFGLGTLEG